MYALKRLPDEGIDMTDSAVLLRERHGSIVVLTMNRPSRRNAFDPTLLDSLTTAFIDLEADPDTRVVILTGAGAVFSAGADLRGDSLGSEALLRDHYEPLVTTIVELDLPIIAAIDGFAVGAGASIALACDFRVMSSDAYFYLPFAGLGLSPDVGSTWLLPRLVGTARAIELAMLGSRVDAATAQAWGLTSVVAQGESSLNVAFDTAERLAGQSASLGAIKAAIHHGWDCDLKEQLLYERALQPHLQSRADYKEAIAAFRERRPSSFGPRPVEQATGTVQA